MKFSLNITVLLSLISFIGCTNANVNVSSLGSVFSLQAQIRTSAPQVVSSPFKVYVQFTEPVQSFSASDVVISNATLLGPIEGSGSEYSFTVSPLGDVSIIIPAFQIQSATTAKYNFDPAYLNVGYDSAATPSLITLNRAVVSNLEGDSISPRIIQASIDIMKSYDVTIPYRIVESLTTMPPNRHTLPSTGVITIPAGSLSGTINYDFIGDTTANANFKLVVSLESTNTMKAILQENIYEDSIVDDDAGNLGRFDSVSLSQISQCRINQSNELYCWGQNTRGELGTGDRIPVAIPTRIDSPNLFSQVSVSEGNHTCAVTTTGILKCWGYNFNGQLGIGSTTDALLPTVVGSNFKFVSTGTNHTCALTNADQLQCWGGNASGQVGNGSTIQSLTSITIGADTYISISSGFDFTCGVTTGNTLNCWGANENSKLGLGDTIDRLVPTTVDSGVSYSTVSTGYSHACAITEVDAQIKCWGLGSSGQIGDGTTTNRAVPVLVDSTIRYENVDVGFNHTCAVTETNILKCWGSNSHGQLGTGTLTSSNLPTIPNPSLEYESVQAARTRTCAVTSKEQLQCWGSNQNQSFSFAVLQQLTPKEIADTNSYQQISASPDSTWGISNQRLFVWGALNNGNLGPVYHVPRRYLTPETPAFIAASSDHQCFISTSKKLFCRGQNANGQLGVGFTSGYQFEFLAVDASERYDHISIGETHTCGVTESGIVKCWGNNDNGQLGDGTLIDSSSPIIVFATGFRKVSAGDSQTCAVAIAGQVYCWGDNSSGQLGVNSTTDSLVPILVIDASTYVDIDAGTDRFCGTTSDLRIKCWGQGVLGGNGDGLSSDNLVPDLISSALDYTRVSVRGFNACGISSSSQLYCWGHNAAGKLGDGTTSNRSTPVLVDSGTQYLQHTTNLVHSCGITSTGRVKCWGQANSNLTGFGSPLILKSPTYIP